MICENTSAATSLSKPKGSALGFSWVSFCAKARQPRKEDTALINRIAEHGKHLLQTTGWAMQGLRAAFRTEKAFQQEVWLLILVAIPGAFYFGESGVEHALLIGSWGIVLITELLNSAIETTIDRIGTEHNELSGRAKDLGGAAVFASLATAAATWGCILFT